MSSSPFLRAGGRQCPSASAFVRGSCPLFLERQRHVATSPMQQSTYCGGGIIVASPALIPVRTRDFSLSVSSSSFAPRKRRRRPPPIYSSSISDDARALPELSSLLGGECFKNESVSSVLSHSIELFNNNSIPEPDWSAVHLLSTALGLDWDSGYRRLLDVLENDQSRSSGSMDNIPDLSARILTVKEADAYATMVKRRLRHEPIQYIVGKWDFCDMTLKVRSPCLCPRPETEELVDYAALEVDRILALETLEGTVRILDVGCGTGAIGLALAKKFGSKVDVTAIDVDETAVKLSNENSQDILGSLGLADHYSAILCGASDFTNSGSKSGDDKFAFAFDVVVSNPPYIPRADMASLTSDVLDYESDQALCGGDDGLDVVRDIVERLPEWSAKGGCVCWMEVDTTHPVLVGKWLDYERAQDLNTRRIQFIKGVKDLCGRDRFVKLIC